MIVHVAVCSKNDTRSDGLHPTSPGFCPAWKMGDHLLWWDDTGTTHPDWVKLPKNWELV